MAPHDLGTPQLLQLVALAEDFTMVDDVPVLTLGEVGGGGGGGSARPTTGYLYPRGQG